MMLLSLAPALLAFAPPERTAAGDLVASLPGWDKPLPSKMYSGYIDVKVPGDREMHVHYIFVESESEPDTDPVLLWTNGGPGASSMFGLFVELGPLLANGDSLKTAAFNKTGVPSLFYNPQSWSRLGSVLMFDWPPPVGFSYCSDPAGNGTSCGDWDDTRMAAVSYAALSGWYERFAERRANPLYLTGESYAGIYVPKLAQQILAHADPGVLPQFKGFAVGDGCLGTKTGVCGGAAGPWWDVLFLYGHGQISTLLWDELIEQCTVSALKHGGPQLRAAACAAALGRVPVEAAGYFAYGLYDDCTYDAGLLKSSAPPPHSPQPRTSASPAGLRARLAAFLPPDAAAALIGGAVTDYICGGGGAQRQWVDQPAVREALHVPATSNFFDGDNGAGMVYSSTEPDLRPFYQHVANSTALRVIVYNGDTDPSINSFVAQEWTSHLGFAPTQSWRAWTIDGCRRMGGYVTRYEGSRFDYLTIRGSGHMVPEFKPAAAFELLRAWLKGEDYRPYVASCKAPH